jgi:hypothetical protein
LSYESLKTRKQRIFLPTSYIQGQEVQEAKEAVESARAGLSQKKRKEKDQGRWSVATRRGREKNEKKKTKEGEKVTPPKARFRVPLTKNFFFGS